MQQFPLTAKLLEGRVATLSTHKVASTVKWAVLDPCVVLSGSD